jgi:hypothetical protein
MEVPVKLVDHHLHVHVHLVIQEQIVQPVTINFYNFQNLLMLGNYLTII